MPDNSFVYVNDNASIEVVASNQQGPQGIPGPTGPTGPAGTGSASVADFVFTYDSGDTEGFKPVPHVYDLELVAPNGSVTRILEGTFNITPEVTR